MTDYSIRLLLADLAKLSGNPQEQAAILDQSTKNNWIGVYALGQKAKAVGNRQLVINFVTLSSGIRTMMLW